MLRIVMRPCDCQHLRLPREMRIKDIIAHLFDHHVMAKKNWTLEQLVAWVESWEPKESRPDTISRCELLGGEGSAPVIRDVSSKGSRSQAEFRH